MINKFILFLFSGLIILPAVYGGCNDTRLEVPNMSASGTAFCARVKQGVTIAKGTVVNCTLSNEGNDRIAIILDPQNDNTTLEGEWGRVIEPQSSIVVKYTTKCNVANPPTATQSPCAGDYLGSFRTIGQYFKATCRI